MPTDQRRRPWWKPLLEAAYLVVGLVSLISGIVSSDWLRLVGGALLLVGGAVALWSAIRPAPPSDGLSAEEARAEVISVAVAGDRIKAIKVLRERTGLGLVEAKETVDRWLGEEGIPRR